MQQALQQLEAMGPPGNSGLGTSPTETIAPNIVSTATPVVSHSSEQVQDVENEEVDIAVLNRLNALKEEKQKYEGMLRQSQNEHENLMNKMNDMRSLIAALGINGDDTGLNSDDEEESSEDS